MVRATCKHLPVHSLYCYITKDGRHDGPSYLVCRRGLACHYLWWHSCRAQNHLRSNLHASDKTSSACSKKSDLSQFLLSGTFLYEPITSGVIFFYNINDLFKFSIYKLNQQINFNWATYHTIGVLGFWGDRKSVV